MTNTYAFVDDSDDPEDAANWQDRIDRWPAIAAYKRIVDDRIGTGRPVLDVGCGTGFDLARIGRGGVGVDRSSTMVRRAREASPAVAIADATTLVLTDPDDAFGLPTWARTRSGEAGGPTKSDVEEWEAGVEWARNEPGFVFAVSYLVTTGRRVR